MCTVFPECLKLNSGIGWWCRVWIHECVYWCAFDCRGTLVNKSTLFCSRRTRASCVSLFFCSSRVLLRCWDSSARSSDCERSTLLTLVGRDKWIGGKQKCACWLITGERRGQGKMETGWLVLNVQTICKVIYSQFRITPLIDNLPDWHQIILRQLSRNHWQQRFVEGLINRTIIIREHNNYTSHSLHHSAVSNIS